MFCPNCGNQNSAEQKFCRSCGLGLEKVAESVSEQLPTKLELTLRQKKERLEKLGLIALSVFRGGLAIPILYSIIYKVMWTQGRITTGLGMLALVLVLASGLLSVILFAKANDLEGRSGKQRPELEGADTRELPEYSNPQAHPFSITDRTTELLFADRGSDRKND